MPIDKSIFATSTALRDSITKESEEYIRNLYKGWAEDVEDYVTSNALKSTFSGQTMSVYYQQLYKQMEAQSKQVANGIYTNITQSMLTVSDSVIRDSVDWASSLGFGKDGLDAALAYVPQSTVNALIMGQVYGEAGSWSLSAAIWGDNEETLRDIYSIVAKGVAQQMPIQKVSELLASYVDPDKAFKWTGPKDGPRIYKKAVDYNAQRLARTLVQHTYQNSLVAATKDNPFVTEFVWWANGSRVCPICSARDGVHYKKDKLPLDHPNGMCVMEPVIVDDLTDKLADWVNAEDGKYPEIDAFAKRYGYDASKFPKFTKESIKSQFGGATYKYAKSWYKHLPADAQATVDKLVLESGGDLKSWYAKEIYQGGEDAFNAATKKVAKEAKEAAKEAAKVVNDALDDVAKAAKNNPLDDEIVSFLKKKGVNSPDELVNFEKNFSPSDLDELFKIYTKNNGDLSDLMSLDTFLKKAGTLDYGDVAKVASKVDDVADDVAKVVVKKPSKEEMKAALDAAKDLAQQKKILSESKKLVQSQMDAYAKDAAKDFDKVLKKLKKEGDWAFTEKLGYGKKSEMMSEIAEIVKSHMDELDNIKYYGKWYKNVLDGISDKTSQKYLMALDNYYKSIGDGLMKQYFKTTNFQYTLADDVVKAMDDVIEKYLGFNMTKKEAYQMLKDELSDLSKKISVINAETKTQKAVAKGVVKNFAGKSYDEAMDFVKSKAPQFYKQVIGKNSDEFADAIQDLLDKAGTDDIAKAFTKYSTGAIKSEKMDTISQMLDDYVDGKLELKVTGKNPFDPSVYTPQAKSNALRFFNRRDADRTIRKWLDDGWDNLTDEQKFSVWQYTHNSHPINRPLSGYGEQWNRRLFKGLDNVSLDNETWVHSDAVLQSSSWKKKFANDGNRRRYSNVVQDLTEAIDQFEIEESIHLVRGSYKNGLAGWFEGTGFDYDDIYAKLNDRNFDLSQLEGAVVQNHAFTSTAIADGSGFGGDVKYHIFAPSGTKGIYAEPQSYYGSTVGMTEDIYKTGQSYHSVGGEAEIILQRGTEFRITKITRDEYNNIDVTLEIIGQPDYFVTGLESTVSNGKNQLRGGRW